MSDETDKVVGIHGFKPHGPTAEANEFICEMLAELTRLAKDGRILGLAVAWEGPPEENNVANTWYRGNVTYAMIGRMEKVKHDILHDIGGKLKPY